MFRTCYAWRPRRPGTRAAHGQRVGASDTVVTWPKNSWPARASPDGCPARTPGGSPRTRRGSGCPRRAGLGAPAWGAGCSPCSSTGRLLVHRRSACCTSQDWTLVVFAAESPGHAALTGTTSASALLGMRVARAGRQAGRRCGWAWSARRCCCCVVPPLVIDADRRGLHDRAADTIVVRDVAPCLQRPAAACGICRAGGMPARRHRALRRACSVWRQRLEPVVQVG